MGAGAGGGSGMVGFYLVLNVSAQQEQGLNNIEAYFELKFIINPIKIIETARSLGIKLKPYVELLPCLSPEEFEELNREALIMGWGRVLNNINIKCI